MTLCLSFGCSTLPWKRGSTIQGHCYSTRARKGSISTSKSWKMDLGKTVDKEKDAFFVVQKGDIVGVYKTFSECQAKVGSSICDPPVSVYKGYSLSQDTEAHLTSCGLKNALYTIRASDLKEDIFGTLTPCPIQEPVSSNCESNAMDESYRRSVEVLSKVLANSCILEFDGASKGNPGKSGAGAVLRELDGSVICRLREGVGTATNNVAEYRAMILGLKYALLMNYKSISVLGDSKLVCLQIQGIWRVRHQGMCELYEIAKKLKDKFTSFVISHVCQEFISEADAQANLAVDLADGANPVGFW